MNLPSWILDNQINQKPRNDQEDKQNLILCTSFHKGSSSNSKYKQRFGLDINQTKAQDLNPQVNPQNNLINHKSSLNNSSDSWKGFNTLILKEISPAYDILRESHDYGVSGNIVKLGFIGEGDFGVVYLVFDKTSHRVFAQKESKNFDNTVMQEHEILLKIQDQQHPFLLQINRVDYQEAEKKFSVVMEYGQGLQDYLEFTQKYGYTWNHKDVLRVYYQLCNQIKELKNLNVVHHDIKLNNIIFSHNGQVKLIDYGLAETVPKSEIQNISDIQTREACDLNLDNTLGGEPADFYEEDYKSVKRTVEEIMKVNEIGDDIDALIERYPHFKGKGKIEIYEIYKKEYQLYLFNKALKKCLTSEKFYQLQLFIEYCVFDGVTEWVQKKIRKFRSAENEFLEPLKREKAQLAYYLMGRILQEQGKYSEAMENYKKSEEMSLNLENEQAANLYNAMGVTESFSFHFESALKYHNKSLKIKKELHGLESFQVAKELSCLGLVEFQKGNNKRALEYFEEAHEICKNAEKIFQNNYTVAKNSGLIVYIKHDIAIAKRELGDLDKALELESQCFKEFKEIKGEKHQMVAVSLANLGKIHYQLNNIFEAIDYFTQSITILKEVAPESFSIALCFGFLGASLYTLSQKEESLESYEQGLAILDAHLPGNPYISIYTANIGKICLDIKRFKKAERYLQRCLREYEDVSKSDDVHYAIGVARNKWDLCFIKAESAVETYDLNIEELKICQRWHPELNQLKQDLGSIYIRQRRFIEALRFF